MATTRPHHQIDGTMYLTVGNGGAQPRSVLPNADTARALSSHGFAEVSVTPERMQIEAWDSQGGRIDQVELLRPD